MDRTPADVLIPIFKLFLDEPLAMPLSLTPVCRHWYNVLAMTPRLWSKVVILVNNRDKIPSLLSSTSLEEYLTRTDRVKGRDCTDDVVHIDIPLDVEIHFREPTEQEHNTVCDDPLRYRGGCSLVPCKLGLERRRQLEELLIYLAGPGKNCQKTENDRIHRWGTLIIDLDLYFHHAGYFEGTMTSRDDILGNPSYRASQLFRLTLQNFPPWYKPHADFAPNLNSLEIRDGCFNLDNINTPNIRSLSLAGNIRFYGSSNSRQTVYATVEELTVSLPIARALTIYPEFPNLKTLRINRTISSNFLSGLNDQFRKSGNANDIRRLEALFLVETPPSMLMMLKQSPIAKNARSIIFQNIPQPSDVTIPPSRPMQLIRSSPWRRLREFLTLCASDTEVTAIDEGSAKVLECVRGEIDAML